MNRTTHLLMAASLLLSSVSWAAPQRNNSDTRDGREKFKGQATSALLKDARSNDTGRRPTKSPERSRLIGHDIPATSCAKMAKGDFTKPAWTDRFERIVAGEGEGQTTLPSVRGRKTR